MIKLFPTIKNKNLNSYYFNKHNNEIYTVFSSAL